MGRGDFLINIIKIISIMLNRLEDLDFIERNKILGEGAYSEVIKVKTKKE